jgi:hypothetical protein
MRYGLMAATLLLGAVGAWAQTSCNGQLIINPPPPLPNGSTGTPYSVQLTTLNSGNATYNWSIFSGTLPFGLNLSAGTPGSATISGTPTAQGSFTFTVRVDVTFATGGMQFGCQAYAVTISGSGFTITPQSLPNGNLNQIYSVQLSTNPTLNGTYSWSMPSGPPPSGVTLNPTTGLIYGTPNATGTFSFTVAVLVTFPGGQSTASQSYSVVISTTGGGFQITTTSLPDGILNQAYSQKLTTNAPTDISVLWSITGTGQLPPGLALGQTTGVISGTATNAGVYTFTVTATEQTTSTTSPPTASQTYTLRVTGSTLSIVETNLPVAAQGSPYSVTLTGVGGVTPYQWTFGNTNTIGLTIDPNTGTISGTPSAAGQIALVVVLKDSVGISVQRTYTLFVATPLRILNTSLANGSVGTPYSQTLMPGGGQPPYTWSIPPNTLPLPPGLQLSLTGIISGTPTTNGTYPITVQLSDFGNRTATASFTITIGPPPAPLTITTTSLPDGAVGVPYSQTLTATGGTPPLKWTIASGTPPAGLTLDATSGVISGTPTNVSTLTFTVQVTDSLNVSKQATFTIGIVAGLSITTTSLPDAVTGVAYSQTLATSGGQGSLTFSVTQGALPSGLSLNTTSGAITGTPNATGTFSFTVSVTDASKQTAQASFTIGVTSPPNPLTITTGNLAVTAGVPFSVTLAGSGGTQPYSFTISGNLPAGLQFNAATGVISGMLTTPGSNSIVVVITDSHQQSATKTIIVTVNPPPAVTISGVPISAPSNTQQTLTVSTAAPPAAPLDGTLTLTFVPPASGHDDAMIVLCNGSRTLTFTIPAGGTQAVLPFGCTPNVVRTGTTAGRITLTAHLNNGGADTSANIDINPAKPVITTATFQQQTSGFTISATGFSNTDELVSATFDFVPASNSSFAASHFVVPLTAAAAAWFQNAASIATGGSFTATFPFTVQGNAQAVVSYKVTVTNAQGDSNTLTGNP